MDKNYTFVGILFLAAAFASIYFSGRQAPPPPRIVEPAAPVTVEPGRPPVADLDTPVAPLAPEEEAQQLITLANEFIEVQFTNFGGAIRQVGLKTYPAEKDRLEPYQFNRLQYAPALSIVDFPGLDRHAAYEVVSRTRNSVVYRTVLEETIEVLRTYSLRTAANEGDPYVIRHETVFRNLSPQTVALQRIGLNLGTSAPIHARDTGYFLNAGFYDGNKSKFIRRSEFEGGGFMTWIGARARGPVPYIERSAPLVWASVKNQFFTSVLTPDEPGIGIGARRVELPAFPGERRAAFGVTANALFDLSRLPPGGQTLLGADFYVGPKEYRRLASFDQSQDLVMQFGFFGFFSKLLLTLLNWIHSWFPNYGIAIVITTLIIKTVFLPLTLQASKSAKRMAKLSGPMQEMKEKYKDNPQKMQMETLKLFKQNRVNPLGGCLPILITIPFFIGFFSMLQSASELRFAEFLWVRDLSAPDTVARVMGLPLNLMPLLMGASMVIQMRLVPTPSVDNAQQKIIRLMPYIFTLVCYGFSAALALYAMVGNIFTIGQQLVINRMKDEPLPAVPVAGTPAPVARAKPVGPVVKTGARKKKKRR